MARTTIYTWADSNDPTITRSFVGDRAVVRDASQCYNGLGIYIYDGNEQVGFGCYNPGLSTTPYTPGVEPAQPYDCINGGCVPKTTYNTPGVYASLAACESGCAKNSNCTGECVSTAEIAALKQAANALQARLCQ